MPLLPIGDFYPTFTDDHGVVRVLNRVRGQHVWAEQDQMLQELQQIYPDRLVSVGIRGSALMKGEQIQGEEIDVFVLVRGGAWKRWEGLELPKWPQLDIGVATWTEDFEERNPRAAAMLATQGKTFWGERVVENLAAPRLGDLRRHLDWVEADVTDLGEAIRKEEAEKMIREKGRVLIKTLVRGSFELVMEKEGKYATDFYPCVSTFLRHFPEWKTELFQLVDFWDAPSQNASEFLATGRRLGRFLTETPPLT